LEEYLLFGGKRQKAIALFGLLEAIVIRARVISTPGLVTGKLKAEITSVSDQRPALNLDFEEREQEWVLAIDDLPPGLYRVTVEAENSSPQALTPVHDLFEVVRHR
jgi:hypothetical protein